MLLQRLGNATYLVSMATCIGVQAYTGGTFIYRANIRPDDLLEITRWEFGNLLGSLMLLNACFACAILWPFRNILYEFIVETFSNVRR